MIRQAMSLMLALAMILLSGCFTMQHELPDGTYFNQEPLTGSNRKEFSDSQAKNYLISGLFAWSDFGTKDMLEDKTGRQITGMSLKTEFNTVDFIVTLIPGLAYGYYVWAPRHIDVAGTYVDDVEQEMVPAKHAKSVHQYQ